MGYSRIYRAGVVILFTAALAGSIIYQDVQKEKQVAQIAAAADEINTLINIHYETGIVDESESDGKTGITTEVWADFESEKWAAVYAKVAGDAETIYQSQLYNGEECYQLTNQDEAWQKEEDSAVGIPNLSALKEFYYSDEDLTGIKVTKEDGNTVIHASLTKEALEEAYQSGISLAQLSYEFYQEKDPDSADAAALLVESAKATQIMSIEVSYTIDAEGILVGNTLTQQYSSPEIVNDGETPELGESQIHTVTYEKKVVSYNSSDATKTLKQYFAEVES